MEPHPPEIRRKRNGCARRCPHRPDHDDGERPMLDTVKGDCCGEQTSRGAFYKNDCQQHQPTPSCRIDSVNGLAPKRQIEPQRHACRDDGRACEYG